MDKSKIFMAIQFGRFMSKSKLIILIGVVFLAAFLRFYQLGINPPSLA